jgi:peptidoglycan hydrolase-like protein with peptidoglycan-binding domain
MKKILAGILIAGSMLGVTAVAHAGTKTTDSDTQLIMELQTQIASLLKQITTMQQQLNGLLEGKKDVSKTFTVNDTKKVSSTDTTKTYESDEFSQSLYIGLKGDDVYALQKYLAGDKSIYPEGKVTGYFGPLTEKAVIAFQKKHGLEGVGVVGPKTRAILNEKMKSGDYSKEVSYDTKKQEAAYEETKKEKEYEEVQKEKEYEEEKKDKYDTGVGASLSYIELHTDDVNEKVWWKSDGVSEKGYKVVWSKTEAPTYPSRDGDTYTYLTHPESDHSRLEAFDGEGTYFVRVCEYVGSACRIYSNEVSLTLTK